MSASRRTSTIGIIGTNTTLVCQYTDSITSKGTWFTESIFAYTTPCLMVLLILTFLASRLTHLLLTPLRQTTMISHIIAGVLLGPTFLFKNEALTSILFPPGGKVIFETLGNLGLIFHLFIMGVQVDSGQLHKTGRKAVAIGLTGLLFSGALGFAVHLVIIHIHHLESSTVPITYALIVIVNTMTSFIVVTKLLTDLKILNSELGRLAASSSMVCDCVTWVASMILMTVGKALQLSQWRPLVTAFAALSHYIILFFAFRPLVIWIGRHTPEGEPLNQNHFVAILSIVLLASFLGETVGQSATLSAFILGVSLPDGPPLGTALANRLETMASGILLPTYYMVCGLRAQPKSLVGKRSIWYLAFVDVAGHIGKFLGTLLPSLYFRISFRDSLSLSLIMCCKGIMELIIYTYWVDKKFIDNGIFTLLLFNMLGITGIATMIVSHLYDPSRRYRVNIRKNILDSNPNADLRILVCIHNEENVPPIINLIRATNPTRRHPISIIVLQLSELTGHVSSTLAPHHQRSKPSSNLKQSERIVNAFEYFEQHSQGHVIVQHFTAEAPYETMHVDVCTLAVDKRTNIVFLPFHKQWTIDGTVGAIFPSIRNINRIIMEEAPCSVAVLVDRSQISSKRSILMGHTLYSIGVFFLGGPDDREALAYSKRMAEHSNVSLTVVFFNWMSGCLSHNETEMILDSELIDEFKACVVGFKERIIYRNENVENGMETTKIICGMDDSFDLVLVGRHHSPGSPVLSGLTEWSECPELGLIGDMLANSDFSFSVLVVQQQSPGAKSLHAPKHHHKPTDRNADSRIYPFLEDESDQVRIQLMS
ncbi:Cation/H+ exchanger [Dillenia turbinata]|uniref:Cation/H+ exchanger n=1 Tax=Dillenia turbinata TaxID=194707 RepID=A0AAN8VYA9_9MAGN